MHVKGALPENTYASGLVCIREEQTRRLDLNTIPGGAPPGDPQEHLRFHTAGIAHKETTYTPGDPLPAPQLPYCGYRTGDVFRDVHAGHGGGR